MTDDERELLLKVAEYLAELLETDAAAVEQESQEADILRGLVAKVLRP